MLELVNMTNNNLLKDIQITAESQPARVYNVGLGNVKIVNTIFAGDLIMTMKNAEKPAVGVTILAQVGDSWKREGDFYWANSATLIGDEELVKAQIVLKDGTKVKLPAGSEKSPETQVQVYDDDVNRGVILSWGDKDGARHAISFIPGNPIDYVEPQVPGLTE